MLVFTTDSEDLLERFPESLHRERVYSVEYPLEGYGKPEAHGAVIDRLREGCLIANYVGHGSVDKLSDEEILVIRDAAQKAIRNEGRQPLFLAWSCSVGSFDLLDRDCLAEAFLKTRGGGMVGAIAATAPTFAGVSRALGMELYSRLFPTAHSRVPVGAALMMAKAVAGGSHNAQKINDQKYNLLGDPALVLGAPLLDISLENPLPLPMTRGEKVTLSGAVRDTLGVLVEGFSGEAEITVYGRADTSGFTWVDTTCTGNPGDPTIRRASYPLLGPLLFRGKATVTGGAFEASFIVPMDTPTGPLARIDIYAHSEESGADGATGTDSVLVLPETGASGGDGEGPRIDITVNGSPLEEWIWFTRNSPFHVEIEDESGLNLQRTDPYFSIHLVFDRGDRIDLTPLFEYDTGSYQRGSFQFRLAELADLSLETGDHELRIIASDTWNNRTEKRYTVVLTEDLPDLAFQQDVLVYPNPFDPNRTEAEFFVDLNREAHVTIQILTVTGKTIREFTGCTASGPTRLADCRWDGRDADGDWVANGVYLVRATAESFDGTRRDETIGKAIVLRGVARKLR